MAVSLAYSASPLLASEMVKFMGFPILMLFIGVLNVLYAGIFYYFTTDGPCARKVPINPFIVVSFCSNALSLSILQNNYLLKDRDHLLATTKPEGAHTTGPYNRFYNTTN